LQAFRIILPAFCLLSAACLPKRATNDEKGLFSISEAANSKAKTRESICKEDGGIWRKENCFKSASRLASRESCNEMPGWSWHDTSRKCLPSATVKNMQRCEVKGQVYSKEVGDCILAESKQKDCNEKVTGETWDGMSCVPITEPKNFYRLCLQQTNSPEIDHTITQLKKMFNLSTCEDTYTVLSKKRILYLQNKNLENLEPLTGLKNLESLVLGKNKIKDIKPLGTLSNLQYLDLYENNVSDLSPIKNNARLETIYLNGNPVKNILPLRDLVYLKEIQLEDTPVHESDRNHETCPHDAKSSLISDYCQKK